MGIKGGAPASDIVIDNIKIISNMTKYVLTPSICRKMSIYN